METLRHLTPADYRRMPWRNGGGTTTELVIEPPDATVRGEPFLFRLSIADVTNDGPFSRFSGYDRHIMLLAGAGMALDCGEHGSIELRTALEPRSFSGDWHVDSTLVGGAVRDLNLIVDRARASSALHARTLSEIETIPCGASETCIIHILAGSLENASEGDTLVTQEGLVLVPRGEAEVVIAHIAPRLHGPSKAE